MLVRSMPTQGSKLLSDLSSGTIAARSRLFDRDSSTRPLARRAARVRARQQLSPAVLHQKTDER